MTSVISRTPLLENGDRMDADEFWHRYEQCEDLHRVELIEGVVYLPSPIRSEGHGKEQALIMDWLSAHAASHDGLQHRGPITFRLDTGNVPEPDALLFSVGPSRFDQQGYLVGVPELIVEIAGSTVSRDLHQKKRAYERNGVGEYIVWRTDDKAIDWFRLVDGGYIRVEPGQDGIIESDVFPGLRLDVAKMLAHDRAGVLAALRV